MPVKGFVGSFCGNSFGARLKYFENLHNLMNLVVKWDLGNGGCRKKYFIFPAGLPLLKDAICRDHAAMCRNPAGAISNILQLFLKKAQFIAQSL